MLPYALSFAAGSIASLSPCVLPALPVISGSALGAHRLGPVALSLGMVTSFTALGLAVGSFGTVFGLQDAQIKSASALLLIALGALLLSSTMKSRLAQWSAPLSNLAQRSLQRVKPNGLRGQFVIGLLLGIVWSPCSGPILGAALGLAAQEGSRAQAGSLLALFGIGSALPFLLIAYGARSWFRARREKLAQASQNGQLAMGLALLTFGIAAYTGLDLKVEAWLLEALPQNYVDLITRF